MNGNGHLANVLNLTDSLLSSGMDGIAVIDVRFLGVGGATSSLRFSVVVSVIVCESIGDSSAESSSTSVE